MLFVASVLLSSMALFSSPLHWDPGYGSASLAETARAELGAARDAFIAGTRLPGDVQRALFFEVFDPRTNAYEVLLSYDGPSRVRHVERCRNGRFVSSTGNHMGWRDRAWGVAEDKIWSIAAQDDVSVGPIFVRLSVFADGRSRQFATFVPDRAPADQRALQFWWDWERFGQLAIKLRAIIGDRCTEDAPEPAEGQELIGLGCRFNGADVPNPDRVRFRFDREHVLESPVTVHGFVFPPRARKERFTLEVVIEGETVSIDQYPFGEYEGGLVIERYTASASVAPDCGTTLARGGELWKTITQPHDGDGFVWSRCVPKEELIHPK